MSSAFRRSAAIRELVSRRGHMACVGLVNPRDMLNIGSVLRASYIFESVKLIAIQQESDQPADTTPSFADQKALFRPKTDPFGSHNSIPVLYNVRDLRDVIPVGCVPVAVELDEQNATPLTEFEHPKRAFYVFGPEKGSLADDTFKWCASKVFIPTAGCLNLAASVNVVLYDRLLKLGAKYQQQKSNNINSDPQQQDPEPDAALRAALDEAEAEEAQRITKMMDEMEQYVADIRRQRQQQQQQRNASAAQR